MLDRRILIVDDEPGFLRGLRRLLKSLGFVVETSTNGTDALTRISSGHRFDVVMTDRMMPEMDGCELAEKIKAQCPQLPVLLITAHPPELKPRSVDSVLLKPCSVDDLEPALAALIPEIQ
jgi:CheY-like chemotaxis protein